MGVLELWTAGDQHTVKDRSSVKVFQALSDGTRQQILQLLESKDLNVGEIVSNFNLTQPTISRHLSILRDADLVVGERYGQQVIYSLNSEALSESMQEFFRRFSGCEKVLR